jgi:hypothetical protein
MGTHPWGIFGGMRPDELEFIKVLDFEYIAMLTSFVFIGPWRYSHDNLRFGDVRKFSDGVNYVLVFAISLVLISIWKIVSLGVTDKRDLVLEGSALVGLSFSFNIIIVCAAVYLIKLLIDDKTKTFMIIALTGGTFFLFVILLAGHRNLFYRYLAVILLLYHVIHKKIDLKAVFIIGAIALFGAALLQNLKMAFFLEKINITGYLDITGRYPELLQHSKTVLSFKLLITTLLGTEFMTASNNLAIIIEKVPDYLPFMHGTSILKDIERALVPGFLFQRVVENTSLFYNRTIFPETYYAGGGTGFTLVGHAYLNFKVPGIILMFALYGLIIKKIYKWSSRTLFGFLFYVSFIPVAILSIRYDLSAPISQSLKHILLPLGLMLIISHVKRVVFNKGRVE